MGEKKKNKSEGEDKSTKTWMGCEPTWVLAQAAGWILMRGSEQRKAGQDEDGDLRVRMDTMISAHTAVPKLPKRGQPR